MKLSPHLDGAQPLSTPHVDVWELVGEHSPDHHVFPFLLFCIPSLQHSHIGALTQTPTFLPSPAFCSPFGTFHHSCTMCLFISFHPIPHHRAEGDLDTEPCWRLYELPTS